MKRWTLDDIDWDKFDRSKVSPDLLRIAKAASMVEYNACEYAEYLTNVFADDPEFQAAALQWSKEEVQHGEALARWAKLADPDFDFDKSFKRFTDTIQLPLAAEQSVRGSRTGELIARCVVESGTSSYYSALAAASDEPVFKEVCQKIAADEFLHFKLFYTHMKRYQKRERLNLLRRAWVAIRRTVEAEDDELAFAYYTANHAHEGPYDHRYHKSAYIGRAYACYKYSHVERLIAMMLKAIGMRPHSWLNRVMASLAYRAMQRRSRKLLAVEATA